MFAQQIGGIEPKRKLPSGTLYNAFSTKEGIPGTAQTTTRKTPWIPLIYVAFQDFLETLPCTGRLFLLSTPAMAAFVIDPIILSDAEVVATLSAIVPTHSASLETRAVGPAPTLQSINFRGVKA
jgi:hypothetical protein